jgi:integrase
MKLNKTTVDGIRHPVSGQQFYWDDELQGFGLRVTPTRKTYIAQRRVAGRTVRVTIAQHGIYTPDKARRAALKRLGEMVGGADINRDKKREQAQGTTLKDAYEDYIVSKRFSPNTLRDYEKAMRLGFDDWADRKIVGINRNMIEARFDKLSQASQAQANQMFRFLRALLNYSMEKYADSEGNALIPSNPCNRLKTLHKWHRIKPRTGRIEPERIKQWFSALTPASDDTPHRNAVRDFCILLILTGLREQEGARLQWNDVDLIGKRITIRNPKNGHVHILPIGTWLVDLLGRRRLEAGLSDFVFPASNKAGHLRNHRRDVLAICKQSGVEFRLHDLRRSFASIVNHHLGQSLSTFTIKRLLNHSSGSDVTADYIQFGPDDLRQPMQLVEDFVLRCAGIRTTGDILPFERKAA